jgi:SNF2 family DNA or RNA helicase
MAVAVEVDEHRDSRIRIDAPHHFNDLIKTIPGAAWSNTYKCWTVPLSWTSCLACRATFGGDLEIGPRLLGWASRERRDRVDPALALREAMDADCPGNDDLYGYQRSGAAFLATVERGMLTDAPGCGKTATTIRAVKMLHDRGEDVFPVLIVSPNTVKRSWQREFEQWWPGVSTVVVDGSAAKRRKQIESGAQVIVINYEALRTHSRLAPYGSFALKRCAACGGSAATREAQCQVHERELNRIDFRTVIADEAHKIKSPKAQATLALRGATGDARFRIALTGTPIGNHPGELWSLLHWMDPQEWPSRTHWTERMLEFSFNVWGGMEITGVKPAAEAEFRATVDPRMRRVTKEVALPFLPPRVFERRDAPMSSKQQKAYDQMADDLVARLDSGILLSSNPMVQTGRLVQFASSYGDLVVQSDGTDKLILGAPSGKIDAFMDDLDDFEGQSVVVFAQSRQLVELLSADLMKKGLRHGLITGRQTVEERQTAIDEFQRGGFPFMLCTIQAGGVGITLTRASVAVFLQRSWSSVDMTQAHDRIYRIGSEQHESVLVVDYVAPGTVEEAQLWALKNKNDLLQQIVRDEDMMRKFLTGGFGRG